MNNDNPVETVVVKKQHLYKLVVVGDSGVGKSSLVLRYTRDFFDVSLKSTIGVDVTTKEIQYDNDTTLTAQLWDTVGQDRFKAVSAVYYRGAHGVLLVFDITSRASFIHLEDWLREVFHYCKEDSQILLVGNKCDLEKQRAVLQQEASAFAEKYQMSYFETSAADTTNVEIAFTTVLTNIHNKKQKLVVSEKETVTTVKGDRLIIPDVQNSDNSTYSCCS